MIKKLALVVVLSLTLSACLPNLGGSGGPVSSGKFLVGQIPNGFPNLPIYKKAKILEGYGLNNKFGVSALTGDSLTKVLDFYNKSLGPGGWNFKLRQASTSNYVFDVNNSTYNGTVIINTAADGKSTAISIALAPR